MTTRIKKSAHDVDAAVSELAEDAAEQVAALKAEAVKAIEERVDALGKAIQQHPFLAIGIGFGIGYVIGRLLRD